MKNEYSALCLLCHQPLPELEEREVIQEGHKHVVQVRPNTLAFTHFSLVRPADVPADASKFVEMTFRLQRIGQRMHLACGEGLLAIIEETLGLPALGKQKVDAE